MAYYIGIDTGGTYTDAVLLEVYASGIFFVKKQAKSFTTKEKLETGIKNSINGLRLSGVEVDEIKRVVLSTTLATNAIIENSVRRVGLIVIGEKPQGKLATGYVRVIKGNTNIKGRVIININEESVKNAVEELLPNVDSIAISGLASVRNPIQEQQVKHIIQSYYNIPAICGHELVNDLGYLERTNTAVLNAGLIPVINDFVDSVLSVLEEMNIIAPVFMVKGDGNIAEINTIKKVPIETVLSGPAASIIGSIRLSNQENLISSDMGGTTTDTGLVTGKRIELSKNGAIIGDWKIKVKSAKLYTFGLGGDSEIVTCGDKYIIGPRRVLPSCRGGQGNVTPTDVLHYTKEFVKWDRDAAVQAIEECASRVGEKAEEYVNRCIEAIIDKLFRNNELIHKHPNLPICAIGAPADVWYSKAAAIHKFKVIIPENFDVANAVGAAIAGVREEFTFTVRPGEEGHGYILHTKIERMVFKDKNMAILEGVEIGKNYIVDIIRKQNLEIGEIEVSCDEIYEGEDVLIHRTVSFDSFKEIEADYARTNKYLESRITVRASGCMFKNERE